MTKFIRHKKLVKLLHVGKFMYKGRYRFYLLHTPNFSTPI